MRPCGAQGARAPYDELLIALSAEGTVPTPLEVLWGVAVESMSTGFARRRSSQSLALRSDYRCWASTLATRIRRSSCLGAGLDFSGCFTPVGSSSMCWRMRRRRLAASLSENNNGDLRLVTDCRRSNCHFEPPDAYSSVRVQPCPISRWGRAMFCVVLVRHSDCFLSYGVASRFANLGVFWS